MRPYLLHQAVEAAAARYPDRPAVRPAPGAADGPRGWTYGELERASRRAALGLRAGGLAPGARVGVWMRKSPAAVGALLATLRAGGVYVPLDTGAPSGRIAALAADCGLWGLYADPDLAAAASGWPSPPRALVPPDLSSADGDDRAALPPTAATGDDLAYILYTSGSTGTPKGVMLTHTHALNFTAWAAEESGLACGDRVASHAPFHFDLSIFDLWATLRQGAEVCLLDGVTARFPRAVADWMVASGITVWYSVPSALVQMAPHAAEVGARSRLRAVIFAGEVFPAPALQLWRQSLPRAGFHNWYGPTETNVCTFYRLPAAGEPVLEPLPIGRACPNFALAVLDDQQYPVEPDQAGYLWVSGPGILAGYWGDASRTAQVVRTMAPGLERRGPGLDRAEPAAELEGAPSSPGQPGQRWYNTGDLVRRGAADELYFEGRRDDLVKCRGYRVSLLEVAQALEACAGVGQAVVVAVDERGAAAAERATSLVAYVSVRGAEPPEPASLRRELGARLPAYMIPERIEVRASLPLTSSGKIDRQRLHPPLRPPLPTRASAPGAA